MAKPSTRSKPSRKSAPAHLTQRLRKLRKRLSGTDADALLVTRQVDIRYLTDAAVDDSWLLVTSRSVWVISDSRFEQTLATTCPHAKCVIRTAGLVDALKSLVGDLKLKKIAFIGDTMTVGQHKALAKAVGASKLKPIDDWLIEQRAVKDEVELRSIRRAIGVMEQAYVQTIDQVRPMMSEREIAALLEYNMRWIGGDGPAFDTIVAVAANGSIPHHAPGRTRVKAGKAILIDFGALADGYRGDVTRVVCMGQFPPRIAEIYDIVREAQLAAIDAIAPGRKLSDIDAVARDIITEAGFGENFGHGLGHGIGLAIHEQPSFSKRSEGVLEPGNVVTVEPGIYLPGVGGVRIEDDVLVTAKGHRKLTTLPSDRESAII